MSRPGVSSASRSRRPGTSPGFSSGTCHGSAAHPELEHTPEGRGGHVDPGGLAVHELLAQHRRLDDGVRVEVPALRGCSPRRRWRPWSRRRSRGRRPWGAGRISSSRTLGSSDRSRYISLMSFSTGKKPGAGASCDRLSGVSTASPSARRGLHLRPPVDSGGEGQARRGRRSARRR